LPYAPLEQYVDHLGHTDARSDLYALGATTYHLLTGQVPAGAQERFIAPESLPSPQEINANVSPETAQAILLAMAPHPKDRPASVALWKQMLNSFAVPQPIDSNLAAGSTWATSLRENFWLVGVAVVMLIAAIVITFE